MTDQETPQATPASLEQEEAQLVAQLVESDSKQQAADEGQESPASAQAESEDRAADTGKQIETKPDSPETSTDRDPVTGRFLPKAKTQPEQAAPLAEAPEQKPESDYAKAKKDREQKDQERFDRNWKKLEERSAAVRQREQQLEQAQRQIQQRSGESRFNADEYERAANWHEEQAENAALEGDLDNFRKSLKNARELRSTAVQIRQKEQQTYETQQREQFARVYSENVQKVIADNPDLGDPETPAAKEMVQLLNGYPILTMHPEGFKWANEILQMRRDSAEVSGLREKITTLERENKELRERTSISGSGPTPQAKSPNIDDMSMEEMDRYLTRKVHESDNVGVPA